MGETKWRHRLDTMIATLHSLTPAEFFDENALRYHSVESDIADLCQAFQVDREKLAPVLATKPVARECWLPVDPAQIPALDLAEVYWRLGENVADERFVDGALQEPFESGSLVAALVRIRDGIDELGISSE